MCFPSDRSLHKVNFVKNLCPGTTFPTLLALYDRSTISSSSGIVAAEINVDLHAHDQRIGSLQFNDHFRDVDIREIALSSRAEAAGADDLRYRRNHAIKSRPGNAADRTTTAWPLLIEPTSRSSISARTRNRDKSPSTTSGCEADGEASSPARASSCRTVPAIGARIVRLSSAACAPRRSIRAAVSCPSSSVQWG